MNENHLNRLFTVFFLGGVILFALGLFLGIFLGIHINKI